MHETNQLMKLVLALVVVALGAGRADAAIGETYQQVDAQYGPGLVVEKPDSHTREYRHNGRAILCRFAVRDEGAIRKGTCIAEENDFRDGATKEDLQGLLNANRGKSKWEEVSKFLCRTWRTVDGKRKATFSEIRVNKERHFLLTISLCPDEPVAKTPPRSTGARDAR